MDDELDSDWSPQSVPARGLDREPDTGTPRWVKVFAIAFIIAVVVIVVMLAGGHRPGQHMQR